EEKLLDTPVVQRLRRVRQLGLTSLVYPSATHTRFQHSLGVMHLAGKFAESLDLDDRRTRELRIAGLLHDTGHGPFSHASEMAVKNHGLAHEDFSCEAIDRLEDYYEVDPQRLHKIIRGELELGQIVGGDIDADRMDYLVRDAHSSGVEHGEIDVETIIRLGEIDSRRLVYRQKAIRALEALFTSRFHMRKTVYLHPTAEIAEKMLQRCIENYIERGNKIERFMRKDDYGAHNVLKNSDGILGEIYSRLNQRKLYKTALDWGEESVSRAGLKNLEENIGEPRVLEAEIAEESGLDPQQVIIDKPSTPQKNKLEVKVKKSGDVRNLSYFSPIPEALKKAEWRTSRLKIYSSKENMGKVKEVAPDILEDYLE
ncbi:MAG: HD domain-containing protein, partial [Candidatus Aenigmatarchaeota archaeon]